MSHAAPLRPESGRERKAPPALQRRDHRRDAGLAAVVDGIGHFLRGLARRRHRRATVSGPSPVAGPPWPRVLVLGIFLADRPHTASHLATAYAAATRFSVTQKWIALNGEPDSAELAAVTVRRQDGFVPKFTLLNRLLQDITWQDYDWIMVSDDDIVVPRGFLDAYLGSQAHLGFGLAQPARTRWSYADHKFTRQVPGLAARRTRFVEIGPVFSVSRQFAGLLFPFDETSPMGWGYDFFWPLLAEDHATSIGIIDATPVDHSLRRQAVTYDGDAAAADLRRYFGSHRHLTRGQAFTVLQRYPQPLRAGLDHDASQ